jgi:adenylate kinase family enzyme
VQYTSHTGDLLRAEAAKPDSPLGKQLQDIMREGRLVPDDITISILTVCRRLHHMTFR